MRSIPPEFPILSWRPCSCVIFWKGTGHLVLQSEIKSLKRLTEVEKEDLLALHCRYFQNVRQEIFVRDLSAKDHIILLRDGTQIVGFSTLQVLRLSVAQTPRVFLFSGDTVVDRQHRLDSHLAGCFGHYMLRLMDQYPDTPLYWFLISKGFRTYRFLPVYFRIFYPACDRSAPPEYPKLLDAIATFKFSGAYDPETGIISFRGSGDSLRPDECEIPEGRLNDPHVRFFLERNPDFIQGNELACLADITRENLNQYAWRVIERTVVTWDE